jgi:hypothetical protein
LWPATGHHLRRRVSPIRSPARALYPAVTALKRALKAYISYDNRDRTHDDRITKARIPGDLIDPARKMLP